MINSVLHEGLKGMQNSQKEMQRAAHDIANFNVGPVDSGKNAEDQAVLPVGETEKPGNTSSIAAPLVELRRQELVFTANAKVVSVADKTLGSILDVES